MKTTKLVPIAIMVLLVACSTVSVQTDYDKHAAFNRYKTYTLAPAAKGETLSPSVEDALRGTLRSELALRGITPAANGKGDLAVVRHVFTQRKTSVQQWSDWGYGYPGAWPYRYGYYGMWAGAPYTYTDVYQYTEGTMILDFVDTRTKKLVFRGTGTAIVGTPKGNAAKMQEAVHKIMNGFPIPAAR